METKAIESKQNGASRHSFNCLVSRLRNLGLDPCWYKRGDQYRFHVHRGSNFWEDSETKLDAAKAAVFAWEEQGCPSFD